MKKLVIRVSNGDTIEGIENKYMIPKSRIYSLNKIDTIYAGQWLYLEIEPCFIYVVKPFDTINTIAAKFKVCESEILGFNDIKEIFIGMKLFIKSTF